MYTADTITSDRISSLRDSAGGAGDLDMVSDCEIAMAFIGRVASATSMRLSGYKVAVPVATDDEADALDACVEAVNETELEEAR